MLDRLLCNPKNCLQSTVYLTAQSAIILFYSVFIIGYMNKLTKNVQANIKNNLQVKILMFIAILIVIASLMYMFINYLCKKDYGTIAWVLAAFPFVSAVIAGNQLQKYVL
jgi:RsiW-degrading membrane proteinase PrsW (M82 family)